MKGDVFMKRKFMTKISACALALCLSCVGFAMPKKASAAAAQPVQLYYAQENSVDGVQSYDGEISVQNLSSTKQVTVHFTVDGKNWLDTPAKYEKADPNNPGYEVWSFDIGVNGDSLSQFAIKCTENGTTYWDNNNGSNYEFAGDMVILGKDLVKVAFGDDYSGIFVQNLGYSKTVGVRYTTDNWATYKDVNATYTDSARSHNMDAFAIPSIPLGAKYAVYYTVNGTTYWDNNYGENYQF